MAYDYYILAPGSPDELAAVLLADCHYQRELAAAGATADAVQAAVGAAPPEAAAALAGIAQRRGMAQTGGDAATALAAVAAVAESLVGDLQPHHRLLADGSVLIERFAGDPLPDELAGIAAGPFTAEGVLQQPELQDPGNAGTAEAETLGVGGAPGGSPVAPGVASE